MASLRSNSQGRGDASAMATARDLPLNLNRNGSENHVPPMNGQSVKLSVVPGHRAETQGGPRTQSRGLGSFQDTWVL